MAWFRRKSEEALSPVVQVAPVPQTPAQSQPPGLRRCRIDDCPSQYVMQCNYVDGQGQPCVSYWCRSHIETVLGGRYCRRHAPVVDALQRSHVQEHLPDVTNRAASLANWVGNDLDAKISKLLESAARAIPGARVDTEIINHYLIMPGRRHRWERAWKLSRNSGLPLKVAVQVDESDDASVLVVVDNDELANIVPPWVAHHQRREDVDPQTDRAERLAFYQWLMDLITEATNKHLAAH